MTDHDHPHPHPQRNGHHHHVHHASGVSGYGLAPAAGPAVGHNAAAQVAQWQEPRPHDHHHHAEPEPDFDLIEASFAENFPKASDPTSFLRLAQIPFVGRRADGRLLRLLRVEFEQATDVGAVTPHVGGATLRYDPLPAPMVSRRQRLGFVYQDGEGTVRLSLAETRGLTPA